MTQRAIKGGEFGANGEWYEGGKFINTVPANKKREGSKSSGTGKQEIAPYTWEVAPKGKRSLYRQFAGVFGKVVDGVAVLRTDSQMEQTCRYMGVTLSEASELISRWNAGERWL